MIRHLVTPFLVLVLSCVAAGGRSQPPAPSDVDPRIRANAPLGLPSLDCEGCALVAHNRYVLLYDSERKGPRWVSWVVNDADTNGPFERTGRDFRTDDLVSGAQAMPDDYLHSGFDQGHMRPAEDTKATDEDMEETFLLTNALPQTPRLNRGQWSRLEKWERDHVSANADVLVLCGPGFEDGDPGATIGDDVAVPDYCWKIIVRNRTVSGLQAIAFVLPNTGDDVPPYRERAITVDALEDLTGIDFFAALPDDLEDALESGDHTVAAWDATRLAASPAVAAERDDPWPVTGEWDPSGADPAAPPDVVVYVTRTGRMYHVAGCPSIRRGRAEMMLSEARNDYAPCSRCHPPE